jgi:hypothetical protein
MRCVCYRISAEGLVTRIDETGSLTVLSFPKKLRRRYHGALCFAPFQQSKAERYVSPCREMRSSNENQNFFVGPVCLALQNLLLLLLVLTSLSNITPVFPKRTKKTLKRCMAWRPASFQKGVCNFAMFLRVARKSKHWKLLEPQPWFSFGFPLPQNVAGEKAWSAAVLRLPKYTPTARMCPCVAPSSTMKLFTRLSHILPPPPHLLFSKIETAEHMTCCFLLPKPL